MAGTVSNQEQDIALIRGVQYAGAATELAEDDAILARGIYDTRFPFARGFAAPVWAILLHSLKLTDNRQRFGFKQSWKRLDLT